MKTCNCPNCNDSSDVHFFSRPALGQEYHFCRECILTFNEKEIPIVKPIIVEYIPKEPCQHKRLEAEFMGAGFIHTCLDCNQTVYI